MRDTGVRVLSSKVKSTANMVRQGRKCGGSWPHQYYNFKPGRTHMAKILSSRLLLVAGCVLALIAGT